MGQRAKSISKTTRRRFLAAGAAGATAVAMPQVSRAQTAVWRFQSTWAPKDIFHEFAADYAGKVNAMSGNRLKFDVLAANSVVPPFQVQQAVHTGILDGGHGVCTYWYGKHKAFALFGSPPSFGWDAHGVLAWFYHGGGEALYKELVNDTLKLNLVGFLCFPMPTQPLGWFKKEITGPPSFQGLKYRTVGLSADLFTEMGAAVTVMPGGQINAAMQRGILDGAEFNNPSSDILIGLSDLAKNYMVRSHHQQTETFEIIFNEGKFAALPNELKAILRYSAMAASTDQLGKAYDRYSNDLAEIRKRGVNVVKTPDAVLQAQLAAWDKVIALYSQEPLFKKVITSQMTWVKRTTGFLQVNNLDSNELQAAYRHFFG